ncbi:MAG: hypothetical protein WCK05_06940 [Planctomycetota bacterium]
MWKLTWIWGLLACASPLAAEVGDLQSVAPGQGLAMFPPLTVQSPQGLPAAGAGAGTASPRAFLATFRREGLTVVVAVDAAKRGSDKLDTFRLDFTGKGDFAAAPTLPARGNGKDAFTAPPTFLTIQLNERKVTILVSVSVYKPAKDATAVLTMGTALKGTCRFGEKVLPVCLLDISGNLSCLDAEPWPYRGSVGDTLMVAADATFKNPLAQVKLGKRAFVLGQWYDVQVSDDLKITATPVKVEMGMINIQMERWQGQLISQYHDLSLTGTKKPISVPAGAYVVTSLQETRPGKPADAIATYAAGGKNISVEPGQTAEVEIGSPIQASLAVAAGAGQVSFGLQATDRTGLRLADIQNNSGRRPLPPTIDVFDASGKKVYSSSMEYG